MSHTLSGKNDEEAPANEASQLLPAEDTNPEDDAEETTTQKLKEPLLHIFFKGLTLICVISLVLFVVAQGLPAPHPRQAFVSILLTFFILTLSAVALIVELELSEWFLSEFIPLLRFWFVKGLFLLFLGILALEQSFYSDLPKEKDSDGKPTFFNVAGRKLSSLILTVAAGGLFLTGTLYAVMGALFMQGLKKRAERAWEARKQESMEVAV